MAEKKKFVDCHEESLHRIGAVQDHIYLLSIKKNDLTVDSISRNFQSELQDSKILNKTISEIFTSQSCESLLKLITTPTNLKETELALKTLSGQLYQFICYTTSDLIVLEYENIEDPKTGSIHNILSSMHRLSATPNGEVTEYTISKEIADEVRGITQYDRVMVYKFHEDFHGEVIAESKTQDLESFLGLHYPESDIPSQARDLYLRNLVRTISDVKAPTSPILSKQGKSSSLDLSDSIGRAVSPIHIEYLNNMNVHATMSISIVLKGKLWGLIACHSYTGPRYVSFNRRSYCASLAHVFSSQVNYANSIKAKSLMRTCSESIESILKGLSDLDLETVDPMVVQKILERNSTGLLSVLNAKGFYLRLGTISWSIGKVSKEEHLLSDLIPVVKAHPDFAFCTHDVKNDFPRLYDPEKEIAGVLALCPSFTNSDCLFCWFRGPVTETVRWAGKGEKLRVENETSVRLSPRGSFAEYAVTEIHKSQIFTDSDKMVAKEFLWLFTDLLYFFLEDSKKKVEILTEASKSKDNFIGMVSHELRTPLNNIMGWLQIYEKEFDRSAELREVYRIILSSAKSQIQLVNDLLDVSRITSGKLITKFETVDLVEIVQSVAQNFKISVETKNISFKLVSHFEKASTEGDSYRIQQVITNLLQNALKFTPEGGSIKIVILRTESDYEIQVCDSGAGISEIDLAKVTEEFYQTSQKSVRSQEGLGLGLAISKNIAELHGGSLSLASEGLSKGTIATLSIPISEKRLNAPKAEIKPASNSSDIKKSLLGMRILLVEDTPDSARFMILVLERHGAKVEHSESGHDALDRLEKDFDFDLVISDIGLPHMDGREFARRALGIGAYSSIPFIALSAYGTENDVRLSIESGFRNHIVKPVQIHSFLETVESFWTGAH